jgi:hypothetical protein
MVVHCGIWAAVLVITAGCAGDVRRETERPLMDGGVKDAATRETDRTEPGAGGRHGSGGNGGIGVGGGDFVPGGRGRVDSGAGGAPADAGLDAPSGNDAAQDATAPDGNTGSVEPTTRCFLAIPAEDRGPCEFAPPASSADDPTLVLAVRSDLGPEEPLALLDSAVSCKSAGNEGWYWTEPALTTATLCGATCSRISLPSANGPLKVDFLIQAQVCTDAGSPAVTTRLAHMAPSLPAIRLCTRPSGTAEPWRELTERPLNYLDVSTYEAVAGLTQDVRLVRASESCDGATLLATTVPLLSTHSTLLLTGRLDTDGNPTTSDSTLRLHPMRDPTSPPSQRLNDVRLVQAVEDLSVDGRVALTGGDWPTAFPQASYDSAISAPLLPANSYPLLIPSNVEGYVLFKVPAFTLAVFHHDTDALLGAWATNGFAFGSEGTTLFLHGRSAADLGILSCDSGGSGGLSDCTPLQSVNADTIGLSVTTAVVHLSPDLGAIDVCRRPSAVIAWNDAHKVASALHYGESIGVTGINAGVPAIKLVPAGTSCTATALVETSDGIPAPILALVGLASPSTTEPSLRFVPLTPALTPTSDAGPVEDADLSVVHAAIGLSALSVGSVSGGEFTPFKVGVVFGEAVHQPGAPGASVVLGVAPLGSAKPTLLAQDSVELLQTHSYGAYVMGVNGSATTPVQILFCDQTPPNALTCRTLALSP